MGISFSSMGARDAGTPPEGARPAEDAPGEDRPFDNDGLLAQWTAYCGHLPLAQANRLRNLIPVVTRFPAVEIVVGNANLKEFLDRKGEEIRRSLSAGLGNSSITIAVRVAEPHEVAPALTDRERFERLKETDRAFSTLVGQLGLELE